MISSRRSVPGRPGGHGGKWILPSNRAVVPATCACPQIFRMAAMAASASAWLHARRSISAAAWGATTLGRSPPRTVPTFTVTPVPKSVSACSAATFCARSQIALAPSSGWSPACEALPVTSRWNVPAPLRAITYSPPGRAGSRMPTPCARFASASITGREDGDSRSSSELNTTPTVVSAHVRVRASLCARSA